MAEWDLLTGLLTSLDEPPYGPQIWNVLPSLNQYGVTKLYFAAGDAATVLVYFDDH